jgi:hypothetical protein
MTWDEIFDAAIVAGDGSDELKAKEEAIQEVNCLVMDLGGRNLDEEECTEDEVTRWCESLGIQFNEYGNILSMKLPKYVEDFSYKREVTASDFLVEQSVYMTQWNVFECDYIKKKVTVVGIGNNYVTVRDDSTGEKSHFAKQHPGNYLCETEYKYKYTNSMRKLFLTYVDMEEEIECERLRNKIAFYISHFDLAHYTLSQLEQIGDIMRIEVRR